MTNPTQVSPRGLELIKAHEGLKLQAYLCPANKVTIGYGHVILPSWDAALFRMHKGVLMELLEECRKLKRMTQHATVVLRINREQADELLAKDAAQFALFISSTTQQITLTQNQFDALASFIFNIGQGNYAASTLRKKLLSGDVTGAADEFSRWVYGTVDGKKVKLNGLITRRAEERALFLECL